MSAWKAPKQSEKKHEPQPPPHRPPHEATYDGLAHISEQIEQLKAQLDRIETALPKR